MKRLFAVLAALVAVCAAHGQTQAPLPSGLTLTPGNLTFKGIGIPGKKWQYSGCGSTSLAVVPIGKHGPWAFSFDFLGGFNFTENTLTGGYSFGLVNADSKGHMFEIGVSKLYSNIGTGSQPLGFYLGLSIATK